MGLANAQRALYYIRVFTEFISQPEYRLLVPIWGIVNEALVGVIGMDQITSFYLEAHDLIRSITGYGEGNGPVCLTEVSVGMLGLMGFYSTSLFMKRSWAYRSGKTSWRDPTVLFWTSIRTFRLVGSSKILLRLKLRMDCLEGFGLSVLVIHGARALIPGLSTRLYIPTVF